MSTSRSITALAVAVCGTVSMAACTTASKNTVAVTGTASACTPAATEIAAGKVTFEFLNQASEISELYVLRLDGSVVGEVENVTTDSSRRLTVNLSAGEYDLVCKPGQQGDGFRTRIDVTGTGGAPVETADRSIEIEASDYSFAVPADTKVTVGESIEFVMDNAAADLEHEMEVFEPSGDLLGEVGPTKPGAAGRVTLTFSEPGTYRLVCGIDDHEDRGMVAELVVADA